MYHIYILTRCLPNVYILFPLPNKAKHIHTHTNPHWYSSQTPRLMENWYSVLQEEGRGATQAKTMDADSLRLQAEKVRSKSMLPELP